MATAVEMPKLGNSVEECFITAWRKHKGDAIAAGEVIADIETDKTTFELTAPADGILLETFFEEGALVPVFTPVCVVGAQGESVDVVRPQASPVATFDMARPEPAAMPSPSPARARLSPRARRFAREHDLHPEPINGTGPGGRVVEADLRDLLNASPEPPATEPPAAGAGSGIEVATPAGDALAAGQRLSPVRDTIARRLRQSIGSTAQYTMHRSANAGELLAMRKRLKDSPSTADITINHLVIFCTIRALLEMPELNAELIDGTLYRHAEVHMAFACDTPRGLVAPVVRDSQNLSLVGLSRRVEELAGQAVKGVITADDLNGGTFTVSNLGSFGVESFTPLLNPPQVGILGVDAIQLKPVRKPDGNIEFVDAIGLSLTVDHQVIDGVLGARFLDLLRDKIERAASLCTI